MQFIKRLLKCLALLILIAIVGFALVRGYLWLQSAERISARAEEETRSNVQWLSSEKALSYTFSTKRTHSVRVLSNAIFSNQLMADQPINYAIEYTLRDKQNRILTKHTYHHASKLTPSENEYQIKQIIKDKQALNVSSGQSFYISPEKLSDVTTITLKLIPEDTPLMGVVVRVHAKTLNDGYDQQAAWLRLPLDRRERATNYHSIGINALSQQEIGNAVTYSWLKLAPQGIPEIDFKTDVLYETLPYNVTSYDFSNQQFNLGDYYSDSNLCASIELKQADKLIFTTDRNTLKPTLTWYDLRQFKAPKEVSFTAGQTNQFITEPLMPGLVTICSDAPLLTNWSLASNEPVITSQDSFYQIDETHDVSYTVEPSSDVNIELRSAFNSQASVIIYDNKQQQIEHFRLFYENDSSGYDRVIDETTQRLPVPKAKAFYLRTTKQAARIVISTKTPSFIRIKSRSPQFNYQRTVCHVYCQSDDSFVDIAAWYEQQADNHYDFVELNKLINIRVFQEPPELEVKETAYQSRELFEILPLSNVGLVNSPNKYFMPFDEPGPFNYGKINPQHLLKASLNTAINRDADVIYTLGNNTARTRDMQSADYEQLSKIKDNANQVFQNWQGKRPWIKQRLYQLSADKPLAMDFIKKRPISVVVKAFTHQSQQAVIISVDEQAHYQSSLTQEYSVAKKRYRLMPSPLSDALLIHPKDSQLYAYPALTHQITPDIKKLNKLTITSNKTIWIAILEEYPKEEVRVRWWNDDTL